MRNAVLSLTERQCKYFCNDIIYSTDDENLILEFLHLIVKNML